MWIWVLGIELDIFIIGVNLTRDSSEDPECVSRSFYKVPEAWNAMLPARCMRSSRQAAWSAVVVGWEV